MKTYVICAAAAAVAVLATGSQAATRPDAATVDGLPLIFMTPESLNPDVAPIEQARRGRGKDDGPGHIRGGGDDGAQHARRGRGKDDGPGHIRHGRGADDPAGHA